MNILAINTSSSFGEVSICKNGQIFKDKISSPYSENIMTSIQKMLNISNTSFEEIDAISCVTGPGSFTGIRIGLAVMKGLCCGQEKKLIEINSFELVSYNIKDKNFVVCLDSGNPDAYYAIFKDNQIKEMGFGTFEQIEGFAKSENLRVYYSKKESEKFEVSNFEMIDCDEDTLSNISIQKYENDDFVSIQQISPVYIKLSQAEIGLQQKIDQNLRFRLAEKNDCYALSLIDSQCFKTGDELYSEKSFEQELSEKSKHYLVALYQNLQIGYIGIQTLGDELNLLKIAVLPQYQKLGIGAKLMEYSLKYFFDNNLSNYFLEVCEDNSSAIKLYKKFNFEVKSKREKYYGDKTALVMFLKK